MPLMQGDLGWRIGVLKMMTKEKMQKIKGIKKAQQLRK